MRKVLSPESSKGDGKHWRNWTSHKAPRARGFSMPPSNSQSKPRQDEVWPHSNGKGALMRNLSSDLSMVFQCHWKTRPAGGSEHRWEAAVRRGTERRLSSTKGDGFSRPGTEASPGQLGSRQCSSCPKWGHTSTGSLTTEGERTALNISRTLGHRLKSPLRFACRREGEPGFQSFLWNELKYRLRFYIIVAQLLQYLHSSYGNPCNLINNGQSCLTQTGSTKKCN